MHAVRALSIARWRTALWLIAAAVLVRALVPAGYMLTWQPTGATVTFCDGVMAAPQPAGHAMAMMHHGHGADRSAPSGKTDKDGLPCAFAAVSGAAALSIDPVLLATAILFIVATVAFSRRAEGQAATARAYLRPPLRGPPARA